MRSSGTSLQAPMLASMFCFQKLLTLAFTAFFFFSSMNVRFAIALSFSSVVGTIAFKLTAGVFSTIVQTNKRRFAQDELYYKF